MEHRRGPGRKTVYYSRRRNRRLAQKRRFKNETSLSVTNNFQDGTSEFEMTGRAPENSTFSQPSTSTSVPDVDLQEKCLASVSSGNEVVLDHHNYCSPLLIEKQDDGKEQTEFHPEGRRLIALDYFLNQIFSSKSHEPFGCNITDMFILQENVMGLSSIITLQCKMCNIIMDLQTDHEDTTELKVNDSATLGIISSGIGYSTAREMMSVLNVPFMNFGTFDKCHNKIANKIHDTLWKQIEENINEEARLARVHGEVDSDDTPTITVIADGAWSKRSYNVNYNALSGVACIIGQRTGKVLYVGIKNKYCCICTRAENKGTTSTEHVCYKNCEGPSTAMEAAIIVEGFKFVWETYGVKFTRLVGDGDSSVHKRLIETRPYGPCIVEKVECTNHLIRKFSKNLREIEKRKRSNAKNLPVSPQLRKLVSSRAYRLVAAIKKAVQYRRNQSVTLEEQISLLIQDLKNAPSHVFGEHEKCGEIGYFNCTTEEGETNHVPVMKECGLYDDVLTCFKRLIDNSYSLILNMTNNVAEHYNSIVAKFVGGKRINYSLRRQFGTRAEASGISYNSRSDYYRILHKEMVDKSPHGVLKKYINHLKNREASCEKRKSSRKQLFKEKRQPAPPDEHYGSTSTEFVADLTEEEYARNEKAFLDKLRKNSGEIGNIEEATRGQAANPIWFRERANRITASNFKAICSLQKKTSCVNTVKKLLFSKFTGNSSTRYGRRNELRAIHAFESQYQLEVKPCGFFIDPDNFMLGASPDGIDALVEIKCPANAEKLKPEDAIQQKVIKFAVIENNKVRLKRNHDYYFQVQGQLQVTKANLCYFVIWTPLGILVEEIERDTQFWKEKMENKLTTFFYKCLLPEIIDSRQSRGMDIRNPPRE